MQNFFCYVWKDYEIYNVIERILREAWDQETEGDKVMSERGDETQNHIYTKCKAHCSQIEHFGDSLRTAVAP